MKEFTKKKLVSALSMLITGLVSTSVSQASDISIYRAAETGSITLMFMLDMSGSMVGTGPIKTDYGITCSGKNSSTVSSLSTETASAGGYTRQYCSISSADASSYSKVTNSATGCTLSSGTYKCYDRISRVKDGMYDLLNGNSSKGISQLSGDKIIGLSLFPYTSKVGGFVIIPAQVLSATNVVYNGTTYATQRAALTAAIADFSNRGSTPTGESYAEAGAYMLGTASTGFPNVDIPMYFTYSTGKTRYYQSCTEYTSSGCTTWDTYTTVNPTTSSYDVDCKVKGTSGKCVYESRPATNTAESGFIYSAENSKNSAQTAYSSPLSSSNSSCSGQGIYFLTDGEPNGNSGGVVKGMMQNALTSTYSGSLSCAGTLFGSSTSATQWSCISDFTQLLLNRNTDGSVSTTQRNPKNLVIKTAVVGFGGDFNGITSYNSALTQAQNLTNVNNAASASDDVKNAARWGIYGQGGWYSGSSSNDVVDSVNSFISALATDIPSVTTGSAYVPTDQLNPSAVQNYTYSSQFQPTPDATYQLWAGNLKKYQVSTGYVKDVKGNSITDSNGKIIDNYDYWSANVSSSITNSDVMKLMGGVKANLPLGMNVSNKANRKVLINRDTNGTETSTTLNKIDESYVTNTTDSSRGYLLSLLGYKIADPANPPSKIADLAATSELRQLGAVMHSSPLLLTQSGVIGSTNGDVTTSNRDDYILFGTTQGVLSVVDASSGVEKFAFVPNEMVATQKKAFLDYTTTSGFSTSTYQPFYYGIDAPWTSYSEYVLKTDKTSMTVGTGVGSSSGVQMAYGGLRMGGRSYYALNLQDMSSPQLAFRIDPNSGKVYYNNSSTAYKELPFMGQSWSKPTIGFVKWNGKKTRVMFVGGGYDAGGTNGDGTFDVSTGERTGFSGYESADYNQASQTKKIGAGVYMFDATTGALLWWGGANATNSNTTTGVGYSTASDMQYSVASQIRGVDRNADDLIDHLYFGDLGGQVWRVDLNNNMATFDKNTFAKTPVRILNLNNGIYSPRFYEMPAFSTYSNLGVKFGVVSIGSGNRSLPRFNTSSSSYKNDAVYNVYDKDVARSDLFNMSSTGYTVCGTTGTTCTGTILNTQNKVLADLGQLTTNANKTDAAPFASKAGWYYYFASSLTQDAKVLSTPIVLDSDMYVTAFDGSKAGLSGDCGAGVKGESFVYQFCMPYGKCTDTQVAASTFLSGTSLGAGIVSPAVGSSNSTGSNRAMISGNGVLAGGKSRTYSTPLSLVPVRWYETTK